MAFLAQSEKDKEDQQQDGPAPVNQDSTSNKTLSSPGAMGSGTGGGQQKTTPKGTSSGSFTNLNNYISANKGNDAQMGNRVAGHVGTQANDADTQGEELFNTAGTAVDAGSVAMDEEQFEIFNYTPDPPAPAPAPVQGRGPSQVSSEPAPAPSNTRGYQVPSGPSTPTVRHGSYQMPTVPVEEVVAVPQVDQGVYGTGVNAVYTGPNASSEVEGFQPTRDAYGRVQTSADLATGDLDDRGTLLRDVYGNDDYTRGQNLLDSFILGAGAEGQQSLRDIGDNYGDYNDRFSFINDMIGGEGGLIDTGRKTTEATRGRWREATTDALGRNNAAIDGAATLSGKENEAREAAMEAITTGLADPATQKATLMRLPGVNAAGADALIAAANGDPNALMKLVTEAGLTGTGDYLDTYNSGRHSELGELLDLVDGNEEFQEIYNPNMDLNATGNLDSTYSVDSETIGAANTVGAKRQELEALKGAFTSFDGPTDSALSAIGLSREDYALAMKYGVNPLFFIEPGPGLTSPGLAGLVGAANAPAFRFNATAFQAQLEAKSPKMSVTDSVVERQGGASGAPSGGKSGPNYEEIAKKYVPVGHVVDPAAKGFKKQAETISGVDKKTGFSKAAKKMLFGD